MQMVIAWWRKIVRGEDNNRCKICGGVLIRKEDWKDKKGIDAEWLPYDQVQMAFTTCSQCGDISEPGETGVVHYC